MVSQRENPKGAIGRAMSYEEEIKHYLIVEKVMDVPLRNQYGQFLTGAFATTAFGVRMEHLVLYKNLGSPPTPGALPVRINSACLTGEVLGCDRCDCKWQLAESMRYVATAGAGLLIYHPGHEGRGLGLVAKLKSHKLVDKGLTTAQAFRKLRAGEDGRRFLSSALILRELGIHEVNLLTNNPQKIEALIAVGIAVQQVTPLVVSTTDTQLQQYLRSKRDEMGHLIPGDF